MSLLIIGTVAFDAIETPFGKTDKIIGGSATYVGLSATKTGVNPKLVAVVGDDFPQKYLENLKTELHNKTIKFLCDNYGKIIIPPFETQKMVSENKIDNRTSRSLINLSYYKFLRKLKNRCKEEVMENNNSRVELMLPGIEKIWVRSSNGKWQEKGKDLKLTKAEYSQEEEMDSFSKDRKWWQFWKKR